MSIRITSFFLLAIVLLACIDIHTKRPADIVKENYAHEIASFQSATAKLSTMCLQKNTSIHDLRKAYLEVRTSFKKIEFLLEYLDPLYVKEWINGAPLPKLDKSAPGLVIIEPKGLQVVDEMMYEKKPDRVELHHKLNEMLVQINHLNGDIYVNDRIVFEALRVELIRLSFLGLTGFDTPGSSAGMQDAKTVWGKIADVLPLYTSHSFPSCAQIHVLLSKGEKELLEKDFDYLHFIRNTANPLFKNILLLQKDLGIETIYESTTGGKFALNYTADNLFAPDLLNASYYLQLPSELNTPSLISLGKLLFYDPVLSADGERACAGCHRPELAFSDGKSKSIGAKQTGTVDRNSPGLINAIYSERFFHDLRADALEDQMEHVVVSEKEFNTTIFDISNKLNQSSTYRKLFSSCFPEYPNPVNKITIGFAMAAYVQSLRGFNSPVDRYLRGETDTLSLAVKRGFNLFMGKAACGTCHFAPVFNGTVPPLYNDSESEVLGVPENPYARALTLDKDPGRAAAKLKENADFYLHSFKTPTVRNIALTAPYMHNGAYQSLKDVMDFYNKGGGRGLGLVVPHQTLSDEPLNLSKKEISDIIAFMEALTDTSRLTSVPATLPAFEDQPQWNLRQVGGTY